MTNMRRGFTMIELIFVIVIIGILAAVAIPKLSATRDDAKISNIIANTRTLMGDLGAYYTSQGQATWDANATVSNATNVKLLTSGCTALDENTTTLLYPTGFALCSDNDPCVTFVAEPAGKVTVSVGTALTSAVCQGVAADPAIVGMVGSTGTKTTEYGGKTVIR